MRFVILCATNDGKHWFVAEQDNDINDVMRYVVSARKEGYTVKAIDTADSKVVA